MTKHPFHLGIDFGANLAGTTAIAYFAENVLHVIQSEKKKSAMDFILQNTEKLAPGFIFIDAPLTLPLAYYKQGADYFFRKCDRELGAMSPMFLGGLTANAARLSHLLEQAGIQVKEVYPAGLVSHLPGLKQHYLKKQQSTVGFCNAFTDLTGFRFKKQPENWHHVDAALAWYSGYRLLKGEAKITGDPTEGLIIV